MKPRILTEHLKILIIPQKIPTKPHETHTKPRILTKLLEILIIPQKTHTKPHETHTKPRILTEPLKILIIPQKIHIKPRETHTEPRILTKPPKIPPLPQQLPPQTQTLLVHVKSTQTHLLQFLFEHVQGAVYDNRGVTRVRVLANGTSRYLQQKKTKSV